MSGILPLAQRVTVVMGLLRKAAEANKPCPTNSELAYAMGGSGMTSGATIISFLEKVGMIEVVRGRSTRVVTICATGQRTAGNITKLANYVPRRKRGFQWTPARDAILMEAIANELDFEQAANLTGAEAEECAARLDALAFAMGAQAA